MVESHSGEVEEVWWRVIAGRWRRCGGESCRGGGEVESHSGEVEEVWWRVIARRWRGGES